MPQSLAQIYLHVIFSTKTRTPFLRDKKLRHDLYAYLSGACQRLDTPALKIGGTEDHVHVACRFTRKKSVADFIREVKIESSKWIKTRSTDLKDFRWQEGYGAFSVSPSHLSALRQYIERQEEHHREVTFQDEMRRLLAKYGVEYDERYVWD